MPACVWVAYAVSLRARITAPEWQRQGVWITCQRRGAHPLRGSWGYPPRSWTLRSAVPVWIKSCRNVPSLPMAGFNMARVPSATVLPVHGGVGKRESLLGSKVWRAHTHAQMRVRTHVRVHPPCSRSTHTRACLHTHRHTFTHPQTCARTRHGSRYSVVPAL